MRKHLCGLAIVSGLWFSSHALYAADVWSVPADEPAVDADDPWSAELVEPQIQAEDPWGAQPVEPTPSITQEPAAPAVDSLAEMRQLQMQLQQISMQLQQIQQQALEVQDVMAAFKEYEGKVRAKMVDLSPDVEDDIATAEELVEELRAVGDPSMLTPEEAEEFQTKYLEFQQAAQRLQPVERQASMAPDIREARAELEEKVMEAMREVNPQAEVMLGQHDVLVERYMELEQQQRQQQPPQQPMFDMPEF